MPGPIPGNGRPPLPLPPLRLPVTTRSRSKPLRRSRTCRSPSGRSQSSSTRRRTSRRSADPCWSPNATASSSNSRPTAVAATTSPARCSTYVTRSAPRTGRRACSASPRTPTAPTSTSTTPGRRTVRPWSPSTPSGGHPERSPPTIAASWSSSTSRSATTTRVGWIGDPTRCSGSVPATVGRAVTRTDGPSGSPTRSASCSGWIRRCPAAGRSSRRRTTPMSTTTERTRSSGPGACGTLGASPSTAQPGISGWPTWARTASRRSRCCVRTPDSGAAPISAGTCSRETNRSGMPAPTRAGPRTARRWWRHFTPMNTMDGAR